MKLFTILTLIAFTAPPLQLFASLAPANDAFASRTQLGGIGHRVSASNRGATKESGERNHAGNAGGASVWWGWTAPENGLVTISTQGSDFDTLLAVYTGDALNSLVLVAENDDFEEDGRLNIDSRVTFEAQAGTSYQIAVDGFFDGEPAQGPIKLFIVMAVPPRMGGVFRLLDGRVQVEFSGKPQVQYTVLGSTDLRDWTVLGTVFNSAGAEQFTDGQAGGLSSRFYKVQEQP
jgi:hypothetical protein